ncbi:hypothetical protein AMECASPLE_008298, partial [Ameca splendens]
SGLWIHSQQQPTLETPLSGEAIPVHPPTEPPGSPKKPQRNQHDFSVLDSQPSPPGGSPHPNIRRPV